MGSNEASHSPSSPRPRRVRLPYDKIGSLTQAAAFVAANYKLLSGKQSITRLANRFGVSAAYLLRLAEEQNRNAVHTCEFECRICGRRQQC